MNADISAQSLQDIKNGFYFCEQTRSYRCLFCRESFEDGRIYTAEGGLADARLSCRLHIEAAHGSAFETLAGLDKRLTSLTETQRALLLRFYSGQSDKDIAKEAGLSPSTVRFQRFSFREKVKQAKLLLAIGELLDERLKNSGEPIPAIHAGATMVDERYMTSAGEAEDIISRFFETRDPPKLKVFSSKEKNKLVILREITKQFEPGRRYSEKEINEVLRAIYGDYATLRRYLIEYGFMTRTKSGSEYRLKGEGNE